MNFFLKLLSVIMLVVLLAIQALLALTGKVSSGNDGLSGRPMSAYESTIREGTVTLNGLGNYRPNSASILINGEAWKVIDAFPIAMSLRHGDIVEIKADLNAPSFYVFLTDRSHGFGTDAKSGTMPVKPGINRLFKVVIKK